MSNLYQEYGDLKDSSSLRSVGTQLLVRNTEEGLFSLESREKWAGVFESITENKVKLYGVRTVTKDRPLAVMKQLQQELKRAGEKFDKNYTAFFAKQVYDCVNEKTTIIYNIAEEQGNEEESKVVEAVRTFFVAVCGGEKLVAAWVTGSATGVLREENPEGVDRFSVEQFVEKWLERALWKTLFYQWRA